MNGYDGLAAQALEVAPAAVHGDEDWRSWAACLEVDAEIFFPGPGGNLKSARRICAGCPVQAECLAWALVHDERYGVWGGLSTTQRRALRRELAVPLAAVRQGRSVELPLSVPAGGEAG